MQSHTCLSLGFAWALTIAAMSHYHTHSRHAAPAELRRVDAREAGLALAARANRWMISGAVIFAGGLAAVTAHAFHARTAASSGSATPAVTRAAAAHGSDDGSSEATLQAPSTPPASAAATPLPAPVVSGGS